METTTVVDYLKSRLGRGPRAALVLGSGLGRVTEEITDAVRIPYADIPGFPRAAVAGHAGALVAGIVAGLDVVALSGRFHLYEGRTASDIAFPLRALAALGVDLLVVTNAAGAVRADLRPGDLMVISDHINLMLGFPLLGPDLVRGERFLDLSAPYDAELQRITLETAQEVKLPVARGVYAAVLGPSYETPAEVRMLRTLGADAVGMSTVPETIVGRTLGMKVLGISCITNAAASVGGGKLSHQEVLEVGSATAHRLARFVRVLLPRLTSANQPTE